MMNHLSQHFSHLLLALYKIVNSTGILNFEWTQSLFVSVYFFYKKHLEDANAKLIKKYPDIFQNGHILDIGANIGYTAYVYSKVLTAPYQIFAFEPEKKNVNILKKVIRHYHLQDKIIMTAAAIGNQEGEVEIWQNDGHHADHRVITHEFRKELTGKINTQKVPLTTIDHFVETHNITGPISFIKIDVQGYELAVCLGMEQTLLSHPRCVVLFEYSPTITETLGYRSDDLIQFFQKRHYFLYRLNNNGTLTELDVKNDAILILGTHFPGYFDIICSKRKL